MDVTKTQPAIYKTWIGPALYIITSRPRDLDIILSKCLDRGSIIKFYNPAFGDGLLTADCKFRVRIRIINYKKNILSNKVDQKQKSY